MNLLEIGPIGSTRRNHAIEHATIHILSRMLPNTSMAGRSNSRGFFIYGDLSSDAIRQAVKEAVGRIRAGEAHLAIHPNCGTNLVTTAVFSAAATMAASAGKRRHWLDRIPSGLLGAMAGVFLGQMIGPSLQQKFTTCAELGEVAVLEVQRRQLGHRVMHWVRVDHVAAPADVTLAS